MRVRVGVRVRVSSRVRVDGRVKVAVSVRVRVRVMVSVRVRVRVRVKVKVRVRVSVRVRVRFRVTPPPKIKHRCLSRCRWGLVLISGACPGATPRLQRGKIIFPVPLAPSSYELVKQVFCEFGCRGGGEKTEKLIARL